MSRVYITSDLHLGHHAVLGFGRRPHDNVEEMFDAIKKQWNSVITDRDVVWILGDVAWSEEWALRVRELRGRKKLIMGNHDHKIGLGVHAFEQVHGARRYKKCILTHIPIHPKELRYGWDYNIHGHLHDHSIDDDRYINVNIDVTREYIPLLFDKVLEDANETCTH